MQTTQERKNGKVFIEEMGSVSSSQGLWYSTYDKISCCSLLVHGNGFFILFLLEAIFPAVTNWPYLPVRTPLCSLCS